MSARKIQKAVIRGVTVVFMLCAIGGWVNAQLLSQPQAKSPEEFDDFLRIESPQAAADIILAGKQFTRRWPDSALLAEVYRMEMQAYAQLNDSNSAIEAGERALQKVPGNIDVLAELAYLLADSLQDAAALARADADARRVLELVDVIRIPRTTSPAQWAKLRSSLEAKAHTALGLVAFKQDRPKDAVAEFEDAARLAPEPSLYYRLGLAYRITGEPAKAIEMLRRAAKTGDPVLRNLAERQLRQ
jgi:tetratricopeptide (TPR) repeat protein